MLINFYISLILLLLLKKVGCARLRESDIHPICSEVFSPFILTINCMKGQRDTDLIKIARLFSKTLS